MAMVMAVAMAMMIMMALIFNPFPFIDNVGPIVNESALNIYNNGGKVAAVPRRRR